jgi:hypothetical protein
MRQLTGAFTDSILASVVTAAICLAAFILLRRRRELWLWWMWLGAVLVVLLMHDLRRTSNHLLLPKYAILTSPAIFLIIPSAAKRSWLRHGFPAAAALLCLWYLPSAYEPKYGDWPGLARFVSGRVAANDVVVFLPGHRADWSGGWTYLAMTHYVHHWPCPVMILDRQIDDGIMDSIQDSGAKSAFIVTDAIVNDPPPLLRVPRTGTVWQIVLAK